MCPAWPTELAHRAAPTWQQVQLGWKAVGWGGERPLSVLAPVPFTEPHLSTLPVLLTRSSPTTQPDLFTEPSPWVISTGTDIALIAGETQGPHQEARREPQGRVGQGRGWPQAGTPSEASPALRETEKRPAWVPEGQGKGTHRDPRLGPSQGHSRWAVRWILLRLFMPHLLALHPAQV